MILYFNLTSFTLWTLCFLLLSGFCKDINGQTTSDYERLQPYNENPYYWQYKGKPILLIAGSDYHNIFQRPDLVEHLDLLKSIGGNYIRNTMASREIFADHRDLWPFEAVEATEDSLINIYDLAKWNDAYWENFEKMLVETVARDMIVEVTIWERHDFYRTRDQAGWIRQPYNPANNINYTADESGLPDDDSVTDPGHPFFATVPELNHNEVVLPYQKAFVDKILSYTFEYNHVMYNMNNETREPNEWGEYWAGYILSKADERGIQIELTDMQDAHNVTDESVARMMDSDVFTFVDISQNNFQTGDLHWERIQYIRNYLKDNPKPITNIKVYGSDYISPAEFWGTSQDGIERFWRNLLGGSSSARFHRPDWGTGLSKVAQTHIRSAAMFAEKMDIFNSRPANDLFVTRTPGSAFMMANPGRLYAVYFPDGGEAEIVLEGNARFVQVQWLDIESSWWGGGGTSQTEETLTISPPGEGHWIGIVTLIQ